VSNAKKNTPHTQKSCKKWKLEKEIQTVRTNQNISYSEARRTPLILKNLVKNGNSKKKYRQSVLIKTSHIQKPENM